jgi:predicted signal transduction protein with EAL and GGDEF domain
MRLRTRIALTFSLLLVAVIAATLVAVSAANRANANREVNRQLDLGALVFGRALDANRRQLAQAAQVLAADFGFREAVATHDADTQASALENHGARIGAQLGVLVAPDGTVLASTTPAAIVGQPFAHRPLLDARAGPVSAVVVEGEHVYQLVVVPVRSPLLVAWVAMGFVLDEPAVRELSSVTGLAVSLQSPDGRVRVSTLPAAQRMAAVSGADDWVSRTVPLTADGQGPRALLSRSLGEALAPFEKLTRVLVAIAVVALLLSAAAVFALARQIAAPLQALTAVIDRIRGGDYHAPVPVQRADEIGAVAEGLRTMQDAVDARDRAIRDLAYRDTLTGLRNRTAFVQEVDARLAAGDARIAVALVNVDRFRRINECLGYAAGDAVLRAWGERLADGGAPDPRGAHGTFAGALTALAARSASTIAARLAADHFAVAATVADDADARAWGAALHAVLTPGVVVDGQTVDVRATVGIALSGESGTTADLLLRCADAAVERARRGKRELAVYEGRLDEANRAQLSLWGELQRAVARDELRLYLQPKCRLVDGVPGGAEVLIRWQHPERGLLAPAHFIPFAEQTGLIRTLTQWMLERSIELAARWQREGWRLPISVNVSALDLAREDLPERVRALLERHRLAPALLTLEITESGFIDDPAHALRVLDALAAIGVGLSIDDFGTGYSSLGYLARMPVQELKIDRSFVIELGRPDMAAVVRSAIQLAQRLEMRTVAEGIEDDAVADQLRALGCDYGQGWHFAKPMPVPEYEAWLGARISPSAASPVSAIEPTEIEVQARA